uniref:Uncharacterized protein n=1 Tax=Romanomermis culicivorax TaxID=13658 RepID=A0A915IFH0_ROMCU
MIHTNITVTDLGKVCPVGRPRFFPTKEKFLEKTRCTKSQNTKAPKNVGSFYGYQEKQKLCFGLWTIIQERNLTFNMNNMNLLQTKKLHAFFTKMLESSFVKERIANGLFKPTQSFPETDRFSAIFYVIRLLIIIIITLCICACALAADRSHEETSESAPFVNHSVQEPDKCLQEVKRPNSPLYAKLRRSERVHWLKRGGGSRTGGDGGSSGASGSASSGSSGSSSSGSSASSSSSGGSSWQAWSAGGYDPYYEQGYYHVPTWAIL